MSEEPRVARIGRYEVVHPLGEGGMGRVLLARDTVLGRLVAVKVTRDDLGLPPETRLEYFERMKNEARAAAALSHPNMVTLHDMGEEPAVGLYLVFEYVDGPTLRDRLHEGPLPPHEVAKIARQLGDALATAHGAGVIHRDVKPENVLLSPTGAKLADFGIARLPDSTLTRAGVVLGTPAYSAPESLSLAQFSPESDQFSLAATLYEAIVGARAYPGDDALQVASRVTMEDVTPIETSTQFDARGANAILARALSKDPKKRFASCRELGDALGGALERRPTLPPAADSPASVTRSSISVVPRSTQRAQNIAAGAAVIVIITLLLLGSRRNATDDAEGASLKGVSNRFAATISSRTRRGGPELHGAPRSSPRPPASSVEDGAAPEAVSDAQASAVAAADAGPP
jgi:eukaryotic-like serine/threonine-protein kinase